MPTWWRPWYRSLIDSHAARLTSQIRCTLVSTTLFAENMPIGNIKEYRREKIPSRTVGKVFFTWNTTMVSHAAGHPPLSYLDQVAEEFLPFDLPPASRGNRASAGSAAARSGSAVAASCSAPRTACRGAWDLQTVA